MVALILTEAIQSVMLCSKEVFKLFKSPDIHFLNRLKEIYKGTKGFSFVLTLDDSRADNAKGKGLPCWLF